MQYRFIHFYCPFQTVLNCSIEQMDQAISFVDWRRPSLISNCCCIQGRYLLILKIFLKLSFFHLIVSISTLSWAWQNAHGPQHCILSLTLYTWTSTHDPELDNLHLDLSAWSWSWQFRPWLQHMTRTLTIYIWT